MPVTTTATFSGRRLFVTSVAVIAVIVGGFVAALFYAKHQMQSGKEPPTLPSFAATDTSQRVATAPQRATAPAAVQVPSPQQASDSAGLHTRCIEQAKAEGYRSGQCAYRFIETCISTQSRSEMDAVLRTDKALQIATARSCPNNPSTYATPFDRF